ncbi:MAG: PAS domain S-box protein [Bacteroidetes bacterium]|nr:PAS domain S-box protein [Bacteroidota bacterium]
MRIKEFYNNLLSFLKPPDFGDEEKNRVAEILNVIAISLLAGLIVVIFQRLIVGQYQYLFQALIVGVMIIFSILLLRMGRLQWGEGLLLWTIMGLVVYLLFASGGLYGIVLLGLPICLLFAGITLKPRMFYVFTFCTLLCVAAVGFFEISGIIVKQYRLDTDYVELIDITIILLIMAITVRVITDNLLRSINKARTSEKAIRKQAEDLRESEEKFRTLTEELPNMVYIHKNGKIVYVNEKCKELIGYSREEIYSPEFDFLSIIVPGHRYLVLQKIRQHLAGIKVDPFEFTLVDKENKKIDCLNISKLIRYEGEPSVLGLLTDLTELKRTQEAIRESQSRLSSIITSTMEAIITLDKHLRIQSFNPASEQMFRCLESEAVGQSIDRFIALTQDAAGVDESEKTENQNSVAGLVEGRIRTINGVRVNGEKFPVEASVSKVNIGKEEIFTIILRDITERVKSEETQRNLQAQLLQSQKMEAVGSLAGGIAHDFNNILSVIIGNSELVKLKLGSSHTAAKYIDEVIQASDRAQELVKQILAFSRKQDSNYRPVRLHYILREGMKLLRASIPATVEIKLDLPTKGPLVLADATQIHQVIMNLCTNAAHAMAGMNGILTLRQRTVEYDDRAMLFHPDLKRGRYAVFTIQDTGKGMDAATIKRVFEPFFTTKGPGKGTGLGLSIVHAIVKNHGGVTKIQSQVGKGTQVEVYLPTYEGEEQSVKVEEVKENIRGSERIMIVDDEPQLLDALTELLKGLGYKASPFTKPVDALKAFEDNPNEYDLLITDHTMPHMTGVALTTKILEIRKDLPVILMTGYDQMEGPDKLKSLGINTVLLKPFKKSVFGEILRNVLKKN